MPAVANEAAHLIQPRRIPSLGYHLGSGENRIGLDVPNYGRVRQWSPGLIAHKNGSQIEPESVNVHVRDPVAETVENHPTHDRLVGIERAPSAGVIRIAGSVAIENVVGLILQAAKAERRAGVIALRGMIEDHVQDHFDTCAVQGLYHIAEFVHRTKRVLARTVSAVWREERYRRIPPVVSATRRSIVGVELEYGHQLNRSDS